MAHTTRSLFLIGLISLTAGTTFGASPAPTTASAPAATALPTIADVRQLFTDAKYNDVVRTVSRITTAREWQVDKADAYELYTMKGESQLHLKENPLAAISFETAAKIASDKAAADKIIIDKGTKEKPADQAVIDRYATERAAAGLARSTAYLIKHSTGAFYVPKATANKRVAGGSPDEHIKIDIMAADTRKTALTAVWTDEKNAYADKITQATDTDGKSMAVIMELAPVIPVLRDFDFGANGNDDDTTKTAQAVADHARDLLQDMLDKMTVRLDIISGEALTVEMSRAGLPGGGYADRWRKHGLEGTQAGELKTMVKNVTDIGAALKILNEGLTPETGFYDKTAKDVKKIKTQADLLLTTDYTQTYVNKDTAMKKGA